MAGRVLDEETLQPIPDVVVRVRDTEHSATTGEDGRFTIGGVAPGTHLVALEHLAYGERVTAVVVRAGEETTVQLRLAQRPIELQPLVVEALTELDQRRRSTGFSMNEIVRDDIDEAARRGMSLWELLQESMPQVRVEQRGQGFISCVEFRGAQALSGGCQQMAIFIDGMYMSAPGTIPPNIPLNDIERVEAVGPGQAGVQWGTLGGNGVLLIETRTGPAPQRTTPPEEWVFGFDWSQETGSYPWARVVASSFVGNALGLGVGLLAAERCLELTDQGMLGTRGCGSLHTLAAGSLALGLPILSGSYAARWGGTTPRSRGRMLPAVVLGSVSALTGYLLLVEEQNIAAGVLLGVATPALVAFSDRVFRVLR